MVSARWICQTCIRVLVVEALLHTGFEGLFPVASVSGQTAILSALICTGQQCACEKIYLLGENETVR